MTRQQLLAELKELWETEAELTLESNLKELEEYDSLSVLSLLAYIHRTFDKQFSARQLNNIDTVQSLIDLIGTDSFDEQ